MRSIGCLCRYGSSERFEMFATAPISAGAPLDIYCHRASGVVRRRNEYFVENRTSAGFHSRMFLSILIVARFMSPSQEEFSLRPLAQKRTIGTVSCRRSLIRRSSRVLADRDRSGGAGSRPAPIPLSWNRRDGVTASIPRHVIRTNQRIGSNGQGRRECAEAPARASACRDPRSPEGRNCR